MVWHLPCCCLEPGAGPGGVGAAGATSPGGSDGGSSIWGVCFSFLPGFTGVIWKATPFKALSEAWEEEVV